MAKSTSRSLFNLIDSLTRSEKRYFKLYAENNTIGSNNHYIMLFDAICKQSDYDEEYLKAAFKYTIKNFKATKYQLYKLILQSLNAFYKHQTDISKVLLNTHSVEILKMKGLFTEAMQLAGKTRKLAEANGFNHLRDELISLENELKTMKTNPKSVEEQMEGIVAEKPHQTIPQDRTEHSLAAYFAA